VVISVLDECTSLKIRSLIARLSAYIDRLEERYKALSDKAMLTTDCAIRQMYKNEAEEIRKIAKQLMTVQAALELMHGEQKLYPDVLEKLAIAVKSIMPELYFEIRELEEATKTAADAVASTTDKLLQEIAAITDEKMKWWGESQ